MLLIFRPAGGPTRFGLLVALLFCALGASARAQTGSVVTVNADKVLSINGRKVFPIGFSPGPPTNGKTATGKDAMQEFHDAGALLVRMTQTTDWDPQLIAAQQAALDWAFQHGMFCWVNLRELSKFSATDTNTPAELRSVVDTFRNHPALGLWKNFDEAWWGGVSAADLQRGYDVIRQEDTNHPIVQTHAPRGTVSDLQPYNVAADILALDIYPIGYPPGANSLLSNKEISMVGDYADFLNQVGNGQKSYWMIEQIAWSGATPPSKTLRFPTFFEERFMAYHAVIHGARGLMFFGGTVAAALNPQDAPLGWNWTFWDQVLKRVVSELGDGSLLAAALVEPNSSLPIQVTGATNIDFCVRETASHVYLIACARQGVTTNVTFSGLPSWASAGELLYESPRAVTASSGQFTDWFAPFEVHVYRFARPSQSTSQLILYEPFDYPNIGSPVSSNTPANWTYGGSPPNDLSVVGGSLNYPGLSMPVGNSATNGGAGLGVRRLFGTTLSSGTVFFSALFRVNNLGYGSWNGVSSYAGALTATDNTSFKLGVMIKSNSPTGYVLGVQKSGTGAATVFNPTEYHAGETVFLAGKYDFNTSPHTAALWINPAPASFAGMSEPTNGFISTTTGADTSGLDRFNMRQNTSSSVPAAMQWDELRVGTSWSDVTPVAGPTLLTNLIRLANGAFQFAYANNALVSGSIYASTNLQNWVALGTASLIAPGLYQFTDTQATNYPRRFYELRTLP